MKKLTTLLFTLLALGGCDGRTNAHSILEVTDDNCASEVIAQIENRTAQAELAGLCSRRSGAIQPTYQPKNWLELNSTQE